MKILIGEITYELGFDHNPEMKICGAALTDVSKGTIFFGASFCHTRDQYDKFTGRKVALENLLRVNHLPREVRKQVWRQ